MRATDCFCNFLKVKKCIFRNYKSKRSVSRVGWKTITKTIAFASFAFASQNKNIFTKRSWKFHKYWILKLPRFDKDTMEGLESKKSDSKTDISASTPEAMRWHLKKVLLKKVHLFRDFWKCDWIKHENWWSSSWDVSWRCSKSLIWRGKWHQIPLRRWRLLRDEQIFDIFFNFSFTFFSETQNYVNFKLNHFQGILWRVLIVQDPIEKLAGGEVWRWWQLLICENWIMV